MSKKYKSRIIYLGVVILIPFVVYGVYWRFLKVYHGYEPIEFTERDWASSDGERRGHMVEDMLEDTDSLHGYTKKQVTDMLGYPGHQTAREYSYYVGHMGFNPWFPMAPNHTLCIMFTRDGVVEQCRVID